MSKIRSLFSKNVLNVFNLRRKPNLKLHSEKCSSFMHEVAFLGYQFKDKYILSEFKKCEAVNIYPVPPDADEVGKFVAFCNYLKCFKENFSLY